MHTIVSLQSTINKYNIILEMYSAVKILYKICIIPFICFQNILYDNVTAFYEVSIPVYIFYEP